MGKIIVAVVIIGLLCVIARLLYLRSEDKRMLEVKDARIKLLKEEKHKESTGDYSQLFDFDTYDALHTKF